MANNSAIAQFLKTAAPSPPSLDTQIRPEFILEGGKKPAVAPADNVFASLFSAAKISAPREAPTQDRHEPIRDKREPIRDKQAPVHERREQLRDKQTNGTETIQSVLETVVLPAVSSSCTQFMDRLVTIFSARLDQIQKSYSGPKILEQDGPIVNLFVALQQQDADMLVTVLNSFERVGDLFQCLSYARLSDLVELMSQFLSRRILLLTMSSSSSVEADVQMALPWVLDCLLAMRNHPQYSPSLFQNIHEQVTQLYSLQIYKEPQCSMLVDSIAQVLDA